jgi:hypothetical protein
MGPKTLPPIWYTYMKLVTRFLPSIVAVKKREAFLDPSDSYFLFADFVDFYTY